MRDKITQAIVLKQVLKGENNRIVTFFSKDEGIIESILYGGAKSKLKSLVSPFHTGNLFLYKDPQRHFSKITDFDVYSYRPTLRENIYKTCAASLCAELLIKTHGGGGVFSCTHAGFLDCFTLVNGFLDGLDLVTEEKAKDGLLRFLYRYLILIGLQPDVHSCVRCGCDLNEKKDFSSKIYANGVSFYSIIENGFVCCDCISLDTCRSNVHYFKISSDALFYLSAIESCSAKDVRQIKLDEFSKRQLKDLLFFLISKITDGNLKTLEAGKGIL